jgi:cell division protein FtsB
LGLVLRFELLYCLLRVSNSESAARRKHAALGSESQGRSRRFIYVVLLFVGSLIAVNGIVGDRGLLEMMRARKQYNDLETIVARQKADNERLREEARRLREDPTAIEELARRELGLIRPGEKVFIIKDLSPGAKP